MTHEEIIDELKDYCRATGLKPSTVCVRALNDSRYVARRERSVARLSRDADRLRKYMADNPAPEAVGSEAAE